MATEIGSIALVTLAAFIGAFGAIFLKKGSEKISITNLNLIFGVILHIISITLYITALRGGELSLLYPLAATSYIWVSIFSVRLLKEEMNLWKWLGVLVIITGVMFIGIGSL